MVPLQLLLGQPKDVSKIVKGQFTDNISDITFVGSETKFIGATLDTDDILYITLVMDESYVASSGFVAKAYSMNYSPSDTRYEIVLESIFLPARKILEKVPQAWEIRVYFATFDTVRDSYGNNAGVDKKIICYMGLTRDKIQKLNWSHVEELLKGVKSHHDELLTYLDEYNFESEQFR
jgi:hypothetical protein